MYKEIILSKIYEYCKKVNHPVKKSGSIILLGCPFCKADQLTANVIPHTTVIHCLRCQKKFTLLDLVEFYLPKEDKTSLNVDGIFDYLKELLQIDVQTRNDEEKLEKILDRYESEGFCLVPCAKKDKVPIQKNWTEKENRNKQEWIGWVTSGLNVGVRTGRVSGVTVIDIDILTPTEKAEFVKESTCAMRKKEILDRKMIPEEIRRIMGNPWIQETVGGFHLFYKYADLPKARIKRDGYFIDLENDGGLVVAVPAQTAVYEEYEEQGKTKRKVAGYAVRDFINDNPIADIPESLKKLLLEELSVRNQGSTAEQTLNLNRMENTKFDLLDQGEGRNSFFTSYGGYLRRQLNPSQMEYALHGLNKMICKTPLESQEITHVIKNLGRYSDQDKGKLESEVLDYLKLAEAFVNKVDIEIAVLGRRATGEEKKRIDEILVTLVKAEKVIPRERYFKILPKMNWTGNVTQVGTPIGFKVPFFYDYAYFNWGDMILIGARTKVGKTTLALNFVKRLVIQDVRPYYIYSESGARWAETAWTLGLKDDDFLRPELAVDDIDEIQFEKDSVNVWDWIDPPDFAKTNEYFKEIDKKIRKSRGFLIGFVQLKENNDWFAPNMIRQRPSLAAKYLYDVEQDGTNTKFLMTEVRAPKVKGKQFTIPCVYDFKTKEVCRCDEIEDKLTLET